MKAILRLHEKYRFQDCYVVEMTLHEVTENKRYPWGVKYGLICINTKTGDKVLMDNHHPKGDHIHLNKKELLYSFTSPEKLISDFKKLVLEHLGVRL